MSRVLPYPALAASLLLMWFLLNGFSLGHLVLGAAIALFATWAMVSLQPAKPRVRSWGAVLRLLGLVSVDVLRSNIAVARLILSPNSAQARSGFIPIELTLRDKTGLAVLACALTATPGTAWVEYRSRQNILLLHVLDVGDEQDWIDLIKQRYEPLLLEIFE
ncbi:MULTISPECIES: Na+/H+ antiporter subunit E [Mesorhizobium]|uniref:Na+/H+ antiporter subunit E n=1 Tax=Mesorhizobium denitrificans TaxID=2294114 RepID=A0A371X933_9HYPH|nr:MULTISPECIES: Na+/H+ antiporter subunit E [Mesorhizobium]RFC65711.1 Na+/H+ antiporter subunit E [Mesorhizobium denitrificans]